MLDTISYDPAARDLSVEVAKAKATGAEIVMLVCRLNDSILLVREMVKQRYNPMGIISPGSPGMYEEAFYKTLGKYSEYCISNVPWYDPKSKLTAMIDKAFTKAFPQDKLMFHALNVGFTVEAMMVAADSFKRAKSVDGTALADAIRQTKITERMMLGGPIAFNARARTPRSPRPASRTANCGPRWCCRRRVRRQRRCFRCRIGIRGVEYQTLVCAPSPIPAAVGAAKVRPDRPVGFASAVDGIPSTALRCSVSSPVAKLASFAALTALKQTSTSQFTRRAARAGHEPCAPQRRRGALRPARAHLCGHVVGFRRKIFRGA